MSGTPRWMQEANDAMKAEVMGTSPRPVFPEAAPPRATTPEAVELGIITVMLNLADASGQEGDSVADRVQITLDAAAHSRVALASLERDAARMREENALLRMTLMAVGALSPSGEPTTTPDT